MPIIYLVAYVILVISDVVLSLRTRYPTVPPTVSFNSDATLFAIEIAAILRGCVTTILLALFAFRMNCGTFVVFPEPVAPETTITLQSLCTCNDAMIAALKYSTGSLSSLSRLSALKYILNFNDYKGPLIA